MSVKMTEQPWWKKILMSGVVWTALLAWANGVEAILDAEWEVQNA